jgi:hypothetical protein
MQVINLNAIPNQEINFVADNVAYVLRLFNDSDMMFMDVTANGAVVQTSCRCLPSTMIIPSQYLEGLGGNFFFTTASGDNPQYENFGTSDILLYASNAEMAQGRAINAAALNTITLSPTQAP